MAAMLLAEARQPGSLVELERVLALEDGLPHERVPVDDYFNEYLHGLSAMAAHQAAPVPTDGSHGPCPSSSCTPPSSAGTLTGTMVPASATGGAPHQLLHAPQQPQQPQQPAAAPMQWQLPMMPHGVPLAQLGQLGAVPMAAVPAGMPMVAAPGKPQAQACAKNGTANGRSAASTQRQATNREAQKRYRERQKARVLEMQVTIDRLTRELAERQGVEKRNAEQHYLLQAQLARVESEADALQWQAQQAAREARQLRRGGPPTQDCGLPGVAPMDADGPAAAQQQGSHGAGARPQPQASHDSSAAGSAVAGTSASPANGSVDGAASEGGATTAGGVDHSGSSELPPAVADAALAEVVVPPEQGGPAGHPGMYGPAPPHESFDELLVRFQAQVSKVKAFLEEQRLRLQDPGTVALSTATRGQLLQLVMESLGICRDLLRVEGVDVIASLQQQDEAHEAARGAAPGSAMREKWLHVIHVLRITHAQKQQLLLQRDAHLALMRRIYQQRQQLNMQAMSLMLLGQGRGGGGAAASGAQAAKLATVLRLVKENLRREQRAAMEINSCTLCRILAPVQAALYICEAFPLHCDALGMCNVVATMGTGAKAHSGAGSAHTPGHSACTPGSSLG